MADVLIELFDADQSGSVTRDEIEQFFSEQTKEYALEAFEYCSGTDQHLTRQELRSCLEDHTPNQ